MVLLQLATCAVDNVKIADCGRKNVYVYISVPVVCGLPDKSQMHHIGPQCPNAMWVEGWGMSTNRLNIIGVV